MKVSTRGRYAIRVMLDLAEHSNGECIPLMDIAKRQDISEKYLEAIVSLLVKAGLLTATRGKKGGYRLTRSPEEYTLKDILQITEGAFAPVSCLETSPNTCERATTCKTLKVWTDFQDLVNDYFAGITLASLLEDNSCADNYSI
ncbi:MAG: Rrf2 family transcriptional regulator [Lachnospiraceae bacterium]|nr:Rrf2 family transcriptional regulator [Lachnospiraceae bacterium]